MNQLSTLSPHLSPLGLTPPGPATDFREWWQLGATIRHYQDRKDLQFVWLWGDWLRGLSRWPNQRAALFGEVGRGDGYRALEDLTGIPFNTLKNYPWLAGRYSMPDGRPDPVRGLPRLKLAHFQVCAAIEDTEARNALLWRCDTAGETKALSRKQLDQERMFLFGIATDCPPDETSKPLRGDDERFAEQVKSHLLEAVVASQGATIARINGNVTEARERLERLVSEGDLIPAQEVRAVARLLEPVVVPVDFIEELWSVIRAFETGETELMLAGLERLAGMKGIIAR